MDWEPVRGSEDRGDEVVLSGFNCRITLLIQFSVTIVGLKEEGPAPRAGRHSFCLVLLK